MATPVYVAKVRKRSRRTLPWASRRKLQEKAPCQAGRAKVGKMDERGALGRGDGGDAPEGGLVENRRRRARFR